MKVRHGRCHRCDDSLELYPYLDSYTRYVSWLCAPCCRLWNGPGTPESYNEVLADLVKRRAEIDGWIAEIREAME